MERQQLAHILRSACRISGDARVLVVGSQAILGSFDEEDLPHPSTASIEVDIAFFNDESRIKADAVEGAIGEFSIFHQTNGYYAEGVHLDTLTLPIGWKDRLIGWDLSSSHPAEPAFLDPHDLGIGKLLAGREKDFAFVEALITHGILKIEILAERCETLPTDHDPVAGARVRDWLNSLVLPNSSSGEA